MYEHHVWDCCVLVQFVANILTFVWICRHISPKVEWQLNFWVCPLPAAPFGAHWVSKQLQHEVPVAFPFFKVQNRWWQVAPCQMLNIRTNEIPRSLTGGVWSALIPSFNLWHWGRESEFTQPPRSLQTRECMAPTNEPNVPDMLHRNEARQGKGSSKCWECWQYLSKKLSCYWLCWQGMEELSRLAPLGWCQYQRPRSPTSAHWLHGILAHTLQPRSRPYIPWSPSSLSSLLSRRFSWQPRSCPSMNFDSRESIHVSFTGRSKFW